MEKRALVAVLISFAVFFGYTKLVEHYYPNASAKNAASTMAPSSQSAPAKAPIVTDSAPALESGESERLVSLENGLYAIGYSEPYGSVAEVQFKKYFDNEKKSAVSFLRAENGATAIGAIRLWFDGKSSGALRGETAAAVAEGIRWTGQDSGIVVSKRIVPGNSSYAGAIDIVFENRSQATRKFVADISSGSSVVVRNSIDNQYIESNWIGADKVRHIRRPGKNKPRISEDAVEAVSIKSRHFSAILKSTEGAGVFGVVESFGKHDMVSFARTAEITLAPGEKKSASFVWYLGPNDYDLLSGIDLGQVVNFGKLDPICKVLIGGMQLAHKLTGNYGLAIILLTVFMNLLLTPLTRASFLSMQRMQQVQPEMNRLKEKYKDDAPRMNQEMMALYTRHKVNPMGGCLPMIAQMPVFMALYVALSKTTELLGASFLWIHDLASPDSVPLPWELPLVGRSLHVLPLLMIVAMVLQQKISMASMKYADPAMAEQQKMMLIVMPIIFGFIFYPMPSGLVLYWLTNTIFTTAYQQFLKSQQPASATLPTRKL